MPTHTAYTIKAQTPLIDQKCSLHEKSHLSVSIGSQFHGASLRKFVTGTNLLMESPVTNTHYQEVQHRDHSATIYIYIYIYILGVSEFIQQVAVMTKIPAVMAWLAFSHGCGYHSQTATQQNKASPLLCLPLLIVNIIVYNHDVVMSWYSMYQS